MLGGNLRNPTALTGLCRPFSSSEPPAGVLDWQACVTAHLPLYLRSLSMHFWGFPETTSANVPSSQSLLPRDPDLRYLMPGVVQESERSDGPPAGTQELVACDRGAQEVPWHEVGTQLLKIHL